MTAVPPYIAPELAETYARMSELALENEPHVSGQHVVSKTLLSRFTAPTKSGRKLLSFNLTHGTGKPRPPSTCGKVDDFIRFASASAERLWQEVENRLPAAIKACDNGSVWDQPDLCEVIKDAIALHFSRSLQTALLSERIWLSTRAEEQQRLLSNPALLTRLFEARYRGLVPAGPQGLRSIVDDLHAGTVAVVQSGAWTRARTEELYLKVRAFARNEGLQIARSTSGEFLIGDIPALSLRQGHHGVGVLGGVALMDATTVVLPLGPRLVAALSSNDEDIELLPEVVETLNRVQVIGAHQPVYMRIGSGLDDFARQVRPPKTR